MKKFLLFSLFLVVLSAKAGFIIINNGGGGGGGGGGGTNVTIVETNSVVLTNADGSVTFTNLIVAGKTNADLSVSSTWTKGYNANGNSVSNLSNVSAFGTINLTGTTTRTTILTLMDGQVRNSSSDMLFSNAAAYFPGGSGTLAFSWFNTGTIDEKGNTLANAIGVYGPGTDGCFAVYDSNLISAGTKLPNSNTVELMIVNDLAGATNRLAFLSYVVPGGTFTTNFYTSAATAWSNMVSGASGSNTVVKLGRERIYFNRTTTLPANSLNNALSYFTMTGLSNIDVYGSGVGLDGTRLFLDNNCTTDNVLSTMALADIEGANNIHFHNFAIEGTRKLAAQTNFAWHGFNTAWSTNCGIDHIIMQIDMDVTNQPAFQPDTRDYAQTVTGPNNRSGWTERYCEWGPIMVPGLIVITNGAGNYYSRADWEEYQSWLDYCTDTNALWDHNVVYGIEPAFGWIDDGFPGSTAAPPIMAFCIMRYPGATLALVGDGNIYPAPPREWTFTNTLYYMSWQESQAHYLDGTPARFYGPSAYDTTYDNNTIWPTNGFLNPAYVYANGSSVVSGANPTFSGLTVTAGVVVANSGLNVSNAQTVVAGGFGIVVRPITNNTILSTTNYIVNADTSLGGFTATLSANASAVHVISLTNNPLGNLLTISAGAVGKFITPNGAVSKYILSNQDTVVFTPITTNTPVRYAVSDPLAAIGSLTNFVQAPVTITLGQNFTNTFAGQTTYNEMTLFTDSATGRPVLTFSNVNAAVGWDYSYPGALATSWTTTVSVVSFTNEVLRFSDTSVGSGASITQIKLIPISHP